MIRKAALVLVDGHNLMHRAWFGFPSRIMSRSGTDRTLTFGFIALLRSAVRSLGRPCETVVVFDGVDGPRARRRLIPGYKPYLSDDDEDHWQNNGFVDLLHALDMTGIQWMRKADSEADDLIAAIVTAEDPDRECFIMSTDKDFYQLLRGNITLLNTAKAASRRMVTHHDVETETGVKPSQWCDYRALTGDPSDGIPGVIGIGPKTAARLLLDGGNLEGIDIDLIRTAPARSALQMTWDQVMIWREAIRLNTIADIPTATSGEPSQELPPAPEVLARLGLWD